MEKFHGTCPPSGRHSATSSSGRGPYTLRRNSRSRFPRRVLSPWNPNGEPARKTCGYVSRFYMLAGSTIILRFNYCFITSLYATIKKAIMSIASHMNRRRYFVWCVLQKVKKSRRGTPSPLRKHFTFNIWMAICSIKPPIASRIIIKMTLNIMMAYFV